MIRRAEDLMGVKEDGSTEFKAAESLRQPDRILGTVTAFLNAGGGILYIGAEETNGIATGVPGVRDSTREKERLMDLAADRIEPRPEISPPTLLHTSPEAAVIVMKVPRGKNRPYGVRQGGSYTFYTRVADRNRPMSLHEAKSLCKARAAGHLGEPISRDLDVRRQKLLGERNHFLSEEGPTVLRVVVLPGTVGGQALDLASPAVREAMTDVTRAGNRRSEWTYMTSGEPRQCPGRLETGLSDPPFHHLSVHDDGWIEFKTELEVRPLRQQNGPTVRQIDPSVLTEYVVSVLRLARHVYLIKPARVRGKVLADFALRGIKGTVLFGGPWLRGRVEEIHGSLNAAPYPEHALCVGHSAPLEVKPGEFLKEGGADAVGVRFVRGVYWAFGRPDDDIDYFNSTTGTFVFPR